MSSGENISEKLVEEDASNMYVCIRNMIILANNNLIGNTRR